MSLFIESICWHHGHYHLLRLHQERLDRTYRHFFGKQAPLLSDQLPTPNTNDKTKVRVVYGEEIQSIEVIPYELQRPSSIKVVETHQLDYSFKYLERAALSSLKPPHCEIIIINNGFVTDASYANLAFNDGQQWFTPKSHLLNGVKRQHLILDGKLKEVKMVAGDISRFESVSLINAMLDLEELSFSTSDIEV